MRKFGGEMKQDNSVLKVDKGTEQEIKDRDKVLKRINEITEALENLGDPNSPDYDERRRKLAEEAEGLGLDLAVFNRKDSKRAKRLTKISPVKLN
jgi:hypothetical protein